MATSTPVPGPVLAYLDDLPADRQETLRPVFDTLLDAMPEGYELGVHWGAPTWTVPLATYPETYNGQALAYVSLAARKSYNALYLMGLYSDSEEDRRFREAWAATGRRLDMGKSCLRFRRLDDVDLGLVGRTVAGMPVERFLAVYERIRRDPG